MLVVAIFVVMIHPKSLWALIPHNLETTLIPFSQCVLETSNHLFESQSKVVVLTFPSVRKCSFHVLDSEKYLFDTFHNKNTWTLSIVQRNITDYHFVNGTNNYIIYTCNEKDLSPVTKTLKTNFVLYARARFLLISASVCKNCEKKSGKIIRALGKKGIFKIAILMGDVKNNNVVYTVYS